MTLSGLILGIAVFIFCLFLAQAVPSFFTLPSQTLDLLKVGILFLGASAIFIGAISKG